MQLKRTKFKDILFDSPFFDSLKADYSEFPIWTKKKSEDEAYIFTEGDAIYGFLYVKIEEEAITEIEPPLPSLRRVKIGTMKIDAHGTRLGERFLKKAFDHAVKSAAKQMYVTVFPKHSTLIALLEEYGFRFYGTKETPNGIENVYLKDLTTLHGDPLIDFPLIPANNHNKYILAIYPEFHTRLFPDSILKNESYDLIQDVSHTNSIHKIYITKMDVSALSRGDILIIYRTKDELGSAYYRAVTTSICVVEEVVSAKSFSNEEYLAYSRKFSVFSDDELLRWKREFNQVFIIKMTYNAAFEKKVIRKILLEDIGIEGNQYWGFLKITDNQFRSLLQRSGINEDFVIY